MIEKFLPLAVIFLLGFAAKRIGLLKKEDSATIGTVLINLVIPAAIAGSFAKISLEPKLLALPLIGAGVVLILLLIGYFLSRLLKLESKKCGAFLISFPTLEGGTIGFALMFALFGEAGLSRIALFDFGSAVIEFSLIYSLAVILGGKMADQGAIASSLKKIIKTPIIWAMFGGVALNAIGVGGNEQFQNVLDAMGVALIPLVMILLGLEFEPKVRFGLPVFAFTAKLAAGAAVGLGIATLFGFEGLERIAVIVGATLPASIMGVVFAEENGLDTKYIASLIAFSIPVYLALFGLAIAIGLI